ncbi:MAG: hypothetical protein U0Q18_28395 [Bryobacteraceae bacterium]
MKPQFAFCLLGTILCAGAASAQMTAVNGASFNSTQPLAPGSFVSIFGVNLCSQTKPGGWIAPGQLPTALGGCSVMVSGAPAMLQYVSPGQINLIIPDSVPSGEATFVVNNGSQQQTGKMLVGAAGPGVFSLNGMGLGEGAMLNAMDNYRMGPFSTSTNGKSTYISMFMTGLDLSTVPVVSIAGIPATVQFSGNAPGFVGLQQVNIMMPSGAAGAGRVPVTVTSNGQTSNVTFMHILPTAGMMQGMPGWGQGMMLSENMPRGHEVTSMAFNPANNTVLVSDENDDVVRIISIHSQTTTATITLPSGAQAHAVAVNAAGTLAAVGLSTKQSVALIDLSQNQIIAVVGTGYYPSRVAFAGTNLLVTNQGGASVSVIDTTTSTVTRTISVGFQPSGISAGGNTAVVANMGDASLSVIDLTSFAVRTVALPPGYRPRDVAISTQANKAVVTTPMENGFVILDLAGNALTLVSTAADTWHGIGPGAVAVDGTTAYIANMMAASVTVADIAAGKVIKTITVDPGPQALAVSPSTNQLLVLCEGTGTLDMVDLASGTVTARVNGADTERQGNWTMPLISSLSPASAAAGSQFTLTILGSNFQGVQSVGFFAGNGGMGTGGMGGGMMGGGPGVTSADPNIQVSNLQINPGGTQITASVQILPAAAAGIRQIRLQTDHNNAVVMGMMSASSFTVTK